MYLKLFILLLLAHFSRGVLYVPLNIVFVSGYGPLSGNQQPSLQKSLDWFHNAITISSISNFSTTLQEIQKISPIYQKFSWLFIQTATYSLNLHNSDPKLDAILRTANFVLILERNLGICQNDHGLLATARPVSARGQRPKMGIMQTCGERLKFENFFDLFRHEIMHSLGYGMYIPLERHQIAPASEGYKWKIKNRVLKGTRHYMDFFQGALEEVKKHFNCSNVRGVEADVKQNHLDEYIFGNELMTANLERGQNYFSYISAAILEGTYFGHIPWYKVNKPFIKPEADNYWYGRDFGCSFLSQSCEEFIEKRGEQSLQTYPLCSPHNSGYCALMGSRNGRSLRRLTDGKCSNPKVSSGINVDSTTRECRFDEEYLYGTKTTSSVDFEIVKC